MAELVDAWDLKSLATKGVWVRFPLRVPLNNLMLDFTLVDPELLTIAFLLPVKIFACWEASKRDQLGWFVLFFLVWFYAIPELVYIIKFRKRGVYYY